MKIIIFDILTNGFIEYSFLFKWFFQNLIAENAEKIFNINELREILFSFLCGLCGFILYPRFSMCKIISGKRI